MQRAAHCVKPVDSNGAEVEHGAQAEHPVEVPPKVPAALHGPHHAVRHNDATQQKKSVVAMERIRKSVGQWSCLKCHMEIMMTKFPKMVITVAPVIIEYISTRT